jgi:2-dehydropantoate 2-reductase
MTSERVQGEHVAVVGAGAVGCYFGGMLGRAGIPVTLIGRPVHVDAIRRDGLFFERSDFQEYIRVDASTDVAAVRSATIVFVCVKTTDTEQSAAAIAPHLAPGALVVSLQNGVDNVERMRQAADVHAIPAVVYVACAMAGPGRVKHHGRGDIVLGERAAAGARIQRLFESAGVPCQISENIARELWTKLVMNCAYNAISALTHSLYRFIIENEDTREVMEALIREVIAVAAASGVVLPDARELTDAALKLGNSMAMATSSTEQDISRRRPTEIDSLNGYVVRKGRELGVPTPVNATLHALVKLKEGTFRGSR